MKKVAIITVNYNGKEDTLEYLKSLNALDTTNLEIKKIVVDNGSDDGSVEAIDKQFKDVDIFQTGANLGFTGGFNRGLEYAKAWGADYYLIINNDTIINSPNLLPQLIKTAETDSKIAVVCPKILFAPGFEYQKEKYTKDLEGKIIWFGGGKFDWNNVFAVHRGIDEIDTGQYDRIEETEYVTGCCLLITNEVLEKVSTVDLKKGKYDLFKEDFFSYMEDGDLNMRLKKGGYKEFYDGTVSIYHKVSRTAGIGTPYQDYFLTRNRLYFGMEHARVRTKFALLRQAFGQLLFGRPFQKEAIWDFIYGKKGPNWKIVKKSQDPKYQIKLSIVTVNYNTADLIKNLLTSIYNPKSGINHQSTEVVLLDNGTLDPTDKIAKQFPKTRYLLNEENSGFPGGYNRAMRFTRGEYILMLNSDMEAMEDSISNIVKTGDQFNGKSPIAGQLIFPNGEVQDSLFKLPTVTGALKEYFLKQKGEYFLFNLNTDKVTEIVGGVLALLLIPRKVINKVGLLDENIFIFFEDIEYARRLKENKIKTYYDPAVKFLHHHGASTKKQGNDKSYQQLIKSSKYYHGKFYYTLLYYTLLVCQKFSGTRTPGEVR